METTPGIRSIGEEAKRLRDLAIATARMVRRGELRTKAWPSVLGRRYLALRDARRARFSDLPAEKRAAAGDEVIRRAGRLATALGAGSGTAVTAAAMFASIGEGAGGLVSFPLAAACAGGEMMVRALVHLAMLCDLAEIYGCAFNRDHVRELMRLYMLALQGSQQGGGRGSAAVATLLDREADELGAWISHQLLEETIARNILPFVGVATSSVTNWRLTARVGRFARRHFVVRRSLDEAARQLEARDPDRWQALVEGMWFLFAADGALDGHETALLTHYLGVSPARIRDVLTARMTEDESDWVTRLREISDDELRRLMFRALEIASATGGVPIAAELAVLRHAGASLGHSLDPDRIAAVVRDFEAAGVTQAPQRPSASP